MHFLDPITIIKVTGLLGIFSIIFAESGLFFGFFLPGDTLLFAAGLFASQGYFGIAILIFGGALSAIAGDNVGYWTGNKIGPKIFERDASVFFNKNRIHEAENFYKKHGPITIILARFVPFIRTFAPIVAGVARMDYKQFFFYNILGGFLWVASVSFLGYYLGEMIPNIDVFLFPVILAVVGFSFIPVIFKLIYHFVKKKRG